MNFNRRTLLRESALGFGSLAMTAMLAEEAIASETRRLQLPQPHHPPTAKSVIFLFMSGAPGQTDTFDPKRTLEKLDGQRVPDSIVATIPNIPRSGVDSKLFASPFTFKQYGDSGTPVSSLFPHTAKLVDELCVVRSMNHRVPVHGPGECIALTGTGVGDRPSLGAWTTYGLGSETKDLPGFVVFLSNVTGPLPQAPGWGAGFLPAQYQGTLVDGNKGVPYTDMPSGYTEADRRQQLDFINEMNRRHLARTGPDSELEARIASYELGYRMQASAPEVFDVVSEPEHVRAMYGMNEKTTSEFGTHCLLARRLVQRGVRCIQLRNGGWDAHSSLKSNHLKCGAQTDKPIAGLLRDLKQRGLLESTLVVWGGEFGRTPTIEGSRTGDSRGRDHSPAGYTMWLAGGGVKGGQIIGATDELGYVPVARPLAPADMHATLLHALGIDQHRLSFNHNNRDEIATVFGGEVIQEVFA
jgi:hypothetical protein